jgi:hypothetical protein
MIDRWHVSFAHRVVFLVGRSWADEGATTIVIKTQATSGRTTMAVDRFIDDRRVHVPSFVDMPSSHFASRSGGD